MPRLTRLLPRALKPRPSSPIALPGLLLTAVLVGQPAQAAPPATPPDFPATAPPPAPQEIQCLQRGWKRVVLPVGEQRRVLLWQAPEGGRWTRGAILVLHGGGGRHFQWCVANAEIVAPQVRFSEMALAEGFAVFLLDSTDRITDREGRLCGKVWDDEVRARPNLDLPFIERMLDDLLPHLRPPGSHPEVFVTGLSSGGYMTVRAATHFDDRIAAFAPVSSGDPYGWHRVCQAGLTARHDVHGAGYDNETGKQIPEPGACAADRHPNEQPWESRKPARKPAFRLFHHAQDGINDLSCGQKVLQGLRQHGYPGPAPLVLQGGRRSLAHHLWLDDYNRPIVGFFSLPRDARER